MLETTALRILLEIAALTETTSTVSLAEMTGVSQQSVSRVITELAQEGLVQKTPLAQGLRLRLTGKGRLALLALNKRISHALGEEAHPSLAGTVTTGMGEGKYYISMRNYKEPLTRLLGGEPYPGTFNLSVSPEEREIFLSTIKPVRIEGFSTPERTYGAVECYPVSVAGRKCAIILPTRTTYGADKAELVDTVSLRVILGLKDGDTVHVQRRGER